MASKKSPANPAPVSTADLAVLTRFLADRNAPIEGDEIERRYKRPRRRRKAAPRYSYAPAPYPPIPRAITIAKYGDKELYASLDAAFSLLKLVAQDFECGMREILAREQAINPKWADDVRQLAFNIQSALGLGEYHLGSCEDDD